MAMFTATHFMGDIRSFIADLNANLMYS